MTAWGSCAAVLRPGSATTRASVIPLAINTRNISVKADAADIWIVTACHSFPVAVFGIDGLQLRRQPSVGAAECCANARTAPHRKDRARRAKAGISTAALIMRRVGIRGYRTRPNRRRPDPPA